MRPGENCQESAAFKVHFVQMLIYTFLNELQDVFLHRMSGSGKRVSEHWTCVCRRLCDDVINNDFSRSWFQQRLRRSHKVPRMLRLTLMFDAAVCDGVSCKVHWTGAALRP